MTDGHGGTGGVPQRMDDVPPPHPAVTRLRLELEAAWRGMAEIQQLAAAHRQRALDDLRAGIPDAAGRAGRVDAVAAMAEIRAAVLRDRGGADWDEMLRTAELAAGASVPTTDVDTWILG